MAGAAASGMRWLMLQSLVYKAVSFFGQIALTHLVSPKDTGLITLALGVAVFTNFLQQQGLREVLVRLRSRHERWDGTALWLAAALGLVGFALTVLAAPVAAWAFRAPEVRALLFTVAFSAPLMAISSVPEAKLQSQLRFKALASIEFLRGIGTLALTLFLAWRGGWSGGAMAFALPLPTMVAVRLVLLWWLARPRITRQPHPRRWRFLFGDSVLLTLASLFGQFIPQASFFIMGRRFDELEVGLYAFANNLSLTTAVVITQNIGAVMFPVFTRFQDDPDSLRRSFIRSGRLLQVLAVPLCFMQGALAGPFIGLVAGERYHGSVPMLQVLSVAMAFVVIWPSSRALMQAQGRFRMCLLMSVLHAAVYTVAAVLGALMGQGLAVSLSVCIAFFLVGIIDPWVALKPVGGTLRDVVGMSLVPLVVSGLGIALPYLLISNSAFFQQHLILQAVAVSIAGGVGCLLLYRLLAPRDLAEILGFVVGIIRRRVLRRG
ncbi:MAG: oligosaccharide flippase family protein [Phycisphaerales bacterium]